MSYAFRRLVEDEGVAPTHANAREFARLACDPAESVTKQADGPASDVNNIVRRFVDTGLLPQSRELPTFGDATIVGSLQDAMNMLIEAGEFFQELPAKMRERFDNDPRLFAMQAGTPEAAEIFREFGYLPKEKAPSDDPTAPGTGGT